MSGLKVGGLFEGYGGLTMGVQSVLGGDLAWYSEIDPGALKILTHRHPTVPNLGDITTVQWLPICGEAEEFPGCGAPMPVAADRRGWECRRCQRYWSVEIGRVYWPHVPEPVDVLCGGFPCQDVSAAGKRAGLRPGTRSGLWAHFAYAIAQLKPSLVVIENVRGLLTARGGPVTDELLAAEAARDLATRLAAWLDNRHARAVREGRTNDARHLAARRGRLVGLRRRAVARARRAERGIVRAIGAVLGSLADLGYDAAWHGLRASDAVGAPHGRFRVFIFAWPAAADADRDGLARLGRLYAERRDALAGGDVKLVGGDVRLLKTPTAQLAVNGGSQHPSQRKAGGHGPTLADEVEHLLPTPAVNDMGEGKTVESWDAWTDRMKSAHGNGNGHGKSLAIEAQRLLPTPVTDPQSGNGHGRDLATETKSLLPTPTARDQKGHNQRGDDTCLTGALLPTPRVGADRTSRLAAVRRDSMSGPSLGQAVEIAAGDLPREFDSWDELPASWHRTGALLPTPRATDGTKGGPNQRGTSGDLMMPSVVHAASWGDYGPAVARWESVTRPAPEPTEPTPRGGRRLSARFTEWMMGVPDGWIVDVPGITRNEALKACGNGVVPQQAAAALLEVLTWAPVRSAFGLAA